MEVSGTCSIALEKVLTYHELKGKYGAKYNGTKEPAAPFEEHEVDKLISEQNAGSSLSLEDKLERIALGKEYSLF